MSITLLFFPQKFESVTDDGHRLNCKVKQKFSETQYFADIFLKINIDYYHTITNADFNHSAVVSSGDSRQTLGEYKMCAAQFGFVESLSGELFGKKQTSQPLLDPLTGSVREIKALAVE